MFRFLWIKQRFTVQYANEYLEFNKQNMIHVYDKIRVKYTRGDNNNVRLTAFILCSNILIGKSLRMKERNVKLRKLEYFGLHVAQNPSVRLGCFLCTMG